MSTVYRNNGGRNSGHRNGSTIKNRKKLIFYIVVLLAFFSASSYILLLHYPYLANPWKFFWGGPDIELVASYDLSDFKFDKDNLIDLDKISGDHWLVVSGTQQNKNVQLYNGSMKKLFETRQSVEQLQVGEEHFAILKNDRVDIINDQGEKTNEYSVREGSDLIYFDDELVAVVFTNLELDSGEIHQRDELMVMDLTNDDRFNIELQNRAVLQLTHNAREKQNNLVYTTLNLEDPPGYEINFTNIEENTEGERTLLEQGQKFNLGFTPIQAMSNNHTMIAMETGVFVFEDGEYSENPAGQYYFDSKIEKLFYCSESDELLIKGKENVQGTEKNTEKGLIYALETHGDNRRKENLRGDKFAYGSNENFNSFFVATEQLLYQISAENTYVHRTPWSEGVKGSFSQTGEKLLKLTDETLSIYELRPSE